MKNRTRRSFLRKAAAGIGGAALASVPVRSTAAASQDRSMIACHVANSAFRIGRRVQWDAATGRVVGDGEVQKLIEKPYRSPWMIPD